MTCYRLNGIKTESGILTNQVYAPIQHVSMSSSEQYKCAVQDNSSNAKAARRLEARLGGFREVSDNE